MEPHSVTFALNICIHGVTKRILNNSPCIMFLRTESRPFSNQHVIAVNDVLKFSKSAIKHYPLGRGDHVNIEYYCEVLWCFVNNSRKTSILVNNVRPYLAHFKNETTNHKTTDKQSTNHETTDKQITNNETTDQRTTNHVATDHHLISILLSQKWCLRQRS